MNTSRGREFKNLSGAGTSKTEALKAAYSLGNATPSLIRPYSREEARSGKGLAPIGAIAIQSNLVETTSIYESNQAALVDILKLLSGEVSLVALANQNLSTGGGVYTDGGGGEVLRSSVESLINNSNFSASGRAYAELAHYATVNPNFLHPAIVPFLTAVVEAGHQVQVLSFTGNEGRPRGCPEMEYGAGILIEKVGEMELSQENCGEYSSPLFVLIVWILTKSPKEVAPLYIRSGLFWPKTPSQALWGENDTSDWIHGGIGETGDASRSGHGGGGSSAE